jgi:hypothetical protein
MLRISVLIAGLALAETTVIGVSSAQAVVCSYDRCVTKCNRAGVKHCLRHCDMRIARRLTSGICPWYGHLGLSPNGT